MKFKCNFYYYGSVGVAADYDLDGRGSTVCNSNSFLSPIHPNGYRMLYPRG
jgi:hypothetical protein